MTTRSYIATLALCLLVIGAVLYLIRKKKLREQYALLWLGVCVVMIVLAAWRSLLDRIAELLGIFYAPSALFLLGMALAFLMLLHFSVVVSKLRRENREISRRLTEMSFQAPEEEAGSGEGFPRELAEDGECFQPEALDAADFAPEPVDAGETVSVPRHDR